MGPNICSPEVSQSSQQSPESIRKRSSRAQAVTGPVRSSTRVRYPPDRLDPSYLH